MKKFAQRALSCASAAALATSLAAHIPSDHIDPNDPATWPCGWDPTETHDKTTGELLIQPTPEIDFAEKDAPHTPRTGGRPDLSRQATSKSYTVVGASAREVTGSLTDKIVYLMAGHGWTYSENHGDPGGVWYTQRPLTNSMVEDMGNLDQAFFMAQYLLNAGATVVPMRPIGHQPNEVVIDNMDAEVEFDGTWTISGSDTFYGQPGDSAPYRWANVTTGTPDATAHYDASSLIPAEGFYPVYVWVRWGSDRIRQQYLVGHSGGVTSRRINHRMVGSGWIYLGTFHFEPGGDAFVTITNNRESSDTGSVVIADAVRFGNGMGDFDDGGGVSGHPREEENARYWAIESAGVLGSTSGFSANYFITSVNSVTAAPRLSTYMNRSGGGANTDRLYLSFHSNAAGSSARGADGLFNSDSATPSVPNSLNTPFGYEFANRIGSKVNTQMRALTTASGNPFEHVWGKTAASNHIYGSGYNGFSAYGEINNTYFSNEMTAALIETAFHTNLEDTQLMRDPKARNAIAWTCFEAVVEHFNINGGAPATLLPEPPEDVSVTNDGLGALTLSWTPPVAGGAYGVGGDAPAGFVVYISENGYGFTHAATVAGGSSNSYNVTSLVPTGATRYFRVAATNAGGESFPSETVAVRRSATKNTASPVLIVNGFNRNDRFLSRLHTVAAYLGSSGAGGGILQRVVPRYNNSFDYSVPLARALEAAGYDFDTCQDQHIVNDDVDLNDYGTVIYIFGRESTADRTFTAAEQTRISAYLSGGGNLIASGTEIGWDLGRTSASSSDRAFLQNVLRIAQFTTGNPQDDALTRSAQGAAGGIFSSVGPFNFSDGSGDLYDADYPDILNPINGSETVMTYVGGPSAGSSAAIAWDGNPSAGRLIVFGFPIEVIDSPVVQADLLTESMAWLDSPTMVRDWTILGD